MNVFVSTFYVLRCVRRTNNMMHNLQIAVEMSMASAVDIENDSLQREMYFGRALRGLLAPTNHVSWQTN